MDDYGHTLGGVRATGPADMPAAVPGRDAPRLDYPLHLFTSGDITVRLTMAPSLNVLPIDRCGLRSPSMTMRPRS